MNRAASRVATVSCRVLFATVLLFLILAPGASAASEPSVTAQYAVVVDADTGKVLFDKSMDSPTAPASLTKIFTAIYALHSSSLDRTLTANAFDLVGESSMGLSDGDQISLETALYGMLLPSGNDAAMTVAQSLGAEPGDTPAQSVDRYVGWLNAMASQLGLSQTHLKNPHGLDEPGHASSAHDIAAIMMYALKNPEFRTIIGSATYQSGPFSLVQANRLLGSYQGLIGGKTGITDQAGYSLVEAATQNGHTVIAVVMKSTEEAWYADASTLLDYGFSVLDSGQVAEGLPTIALAPVVIQPGTLGVAAPIEAKPAVPVQRASTDLSVHQVNDNVAIVQHKLLGSGASGLSWKWPLTSLISMVAVLALALNYPIVIGAGSLVWKHGKPSTRALAVPFAMMKATTRAVPHHRRRARLHSDARRRRTRATPRQSLAPEPHTSLFAFAEPVQPAWTAPSNIVPLNAAETIAARGVRLALRGDYHAATSEFVRALHNDTAFDLSRADGFWGMQPAGFVSAARAYALNDRTADAKSLLTVIKLSCGSHKELESLLRQVVGAR